MSSRHQLLVSLWRSLSDDDRTFLIELDKKDRTCSSIIHEKTLMKEEVKEDVKEKEEDQDKKANTFETGYSKSRLTELVKQHTIISSSDDDLNNDLSKNLERIHSGQRLSTIPITSSTTPSASTPSATSSYFSRKIVKSNSTAPDDSSNSSNRMNKTDRTNLMKRSDTVNTNGSMSENQQDIIVRQLLTQQTILEHARRGGNCCYSYYGICITSVYHFFSPNPISNRAKMMDKFIIFLVCANVIITVISTEDAWFRDNNTLLMFQTFETISFIVFAIEYVLRVWVRKIIFICLLQCYYCTR